MTKRRQSVFKDDVFDTRHGPCKVIKYENARNVQVKFLNTGYKTWTTAQYVQLGTVRDLLSPTTEGVGFLGVGPYTRKRHRLEYDLWVHMLTRCYSKSKIKQTVAYVEATVEKRWHNFQNFCRDIVKFKNWNKSGFELDKDLLYPGSKVYSRKTCWFAPTNLNKTLNSNTFKPDVHKVNNRYEVRITENTIRKFIGSFKTRKEAMNAWVEGKLKIFKALAKKYHKYLPELVRNNLMTGIYLYKKHD